MVGIDEQWGVNEGELRKKICFKVFEDRHAMPLC